MSYFFRTLFVKINSSRLIFESIKALEIKTSMLFILNYANNSIFSYLFLFILIIDFYFLIPAFIAQIFNPTAELIIPLQISSKEAKAEIEIYPVTVDVKIRKCSI